MCTLPSPVYKPTTCLQCVFVDVAAVWDSGKEVKSQSPYLASLTSSNPSSMHPWEKLRNQIYPSCLQANPSAENSDQPHKHTEECIKNFHPMPLNSSATNTDNKQCSRLPYVSKVSVLLATRSSFLIFSTFFLHVCLNHVTYRLAKLINMGELKYNTSDCWISEYIK